MKKANSQANLEDVETTESEINSYIKQYMILEKLAKKSNNEVQYWRNQKSKLLDSNSNIEAYLGKLSQNVSDIEEKISENTRIHVLKKQELKDLQNMRTNISHKQWNDCLSSIGNYANDFSQWLTDYSEHVLMKDIENHQKECEKVGRELTILREELNDMIQKCDLNCIIEANVDANDLSNLNIIPEVKLSNINLMKNIKLGKDNLNKVQNKIKQSKMIFNESKTKEKMKLF